MNYNFDHIVDRRGTDSVKYDRCEAFGKPKSAIPLWIADMDFPSPPCVQQALADRISHGIYGYSNVGPQYIAALKGWFSRRYEWEVSPDWLITTPGIVTAIYMGIRALTEPGDSVLIQPPVYHPFLQSIQATGRNPVENPLVWEDGHYRMDLTHMEDMIKTHQIKLMVLCNPHNPVGRVWTRAELSALGDLCVKYGVKVISDEIHADFIYPGHKHLVFASIKPEFQDITITCTAPSKTFNLAGLQISNIFIPNQQIRDRFKKELAQCGVGEAGLMGLIACGAAYTGGDDWLDALLVYLKQTVNYAQQFLQKNLPEVHFVTPQGTYLLWLDCRKLNTGGLPLNDFITKKAGLWLNDGAMFGTGGEGFQRVNIACPRSIVASALEKLANASKSV